MFHIERNTLQSNRTNEHEHDMNKTNGKSYYTIFTHNVLRRVCYANTGRLLYFEQTHVYSRFTPDNAGVQVVVRMRCVVGSIAYKGE